MNDLQTDALRLLRAVATVAAPVVLFLLVLAVWLKWKRARQQQQQAIVVVVPGLLVLSFFVLMVLCQALLGGVLNTVLPLAEGAEPAEVEARQLRVSIWASVLSALVFFAVVGIVHFITVWNLLQKSPSFAVAVRSLFLALCVWCVVTPVVMGIQLCLTVLFTWQGWPVTEHPLSRLGIGGDGYGGWLVAVSASLAAPFLEEFLFRGLLLPWVRQKLLHCWLVVGLAVCVALLGSMKPTGISSLSPLLWVAMLAVVQASANGLSVSHRTDWLPGVVASSTLFAALHSSVWPTPIPLFFLGVALGWLAVKTQSWWPCFVVHALFNLTSTVYLVLQG